MSASILIEKKDYKYMAEKYSQMNESQVEFGKELLALLDLKHGKKVLDMGCGTGELTSFTASQVGEEGEVLGIDPDKERVKIAVQKHCGTKKNIQFMVGDSYSHFPHFNEEYYDAHYSNYVFFWLTTQEKDMYVKAAYNCLKPGGRIAIHSTKGNIELFESALELIPDEEIESDKKLFKFIDKSGAESILKNVGFEIVSSEYVTCEVTFPSLDYFIAWFCSWGYVDESKIVSNKKEAFAKKFVNDDGSVYYFDPMLYRIIAKKSTKRP